jgi:hypothetical protein
MMRLDMREIVNNVTSVIEYRSKLIQAGVPSKEVTELVLGLQQSIIAAISMVDIQREILERKELQDEPWKMESLELQNLKILARSVLDAWDKGYITVGMDAPNELEEKIIAPFRAIVDALG